MSLLLGGGKAASLPWLVCCLVTAICFTSAQRLQLCLLSENVDCIRCSTNVTVDAASGGDCSRSSGDGGRGATTLHGRVCSRLVDVLESIAARATIPQTPIESGVSFCVAVFVYPTESASPHVVPAVPLGASGAARQIAGSAVVIRGVSMVEADATRNKRQAGTSTSTTRRLPRVLFEAALGDSSQQATYVLQFSTSTLVVFSNIEFLGTVGIIGMSQISLVVVEQCSFRNFIQGAVDIYNSPTVLVRASNFSGNGFAQLTKTEQYRGQAGGLSVGYNQNNRELRVNISRCTFFNNSAEVTTANVVVPSTGNETEATPTKMPPSRGMSSPSQLNQQQEVRGEVIVGRFFPGRGGGVAVIVNDMFRASIVVEDSFFLENVALESGGGLYFLLDGRASHSVTVSRCSFSLNSSPANAGALQVTFLQEGETGEEIQVFVYDTNFTSNQANYGGAVYLLPLTVNIAESLEDGQLGILTKFERCSFDTNSAVEVGGALGVAFSLVAQALQSIFPLEIIDCTFTRNTVVGGGVVSTAYYPLSFRGKNVFELSHGPSLVIVGTRVSVSGSLLFSTNSNTGSLDGGSLYITSLGQVQLNPGATITFVNNSGTLGASIFAENPTIPDVYSRLLYNPLCSITHSSNRLPPDLWNASLNFISNTALVASAVFTNNLNLCSWTDLVPPFFNSSTAFRWDFVNFPRDRPNLNNAHRNTSDQRFSVQTPAVDLKIIKKQITVFPGENIGLQVLARDELGVATSALFTLSDDSIVSGRGLQDKNGELYRFAPSSLNLVQLGRNVELDVRMKIRNTSALGRTEKIEAKLLTDNQKYLSVKDDFSIQSRPCPPGQRFQEMNQFRECVCDAADVDIINCDRRKVHIEDHLWGSMAPASADVNNGLLTMSCPSQYCHCTPLNTSGVLKCTFIFDHELPNSQCHCNRTGVLCGGCEEGLGFSALLDKCVSCSNVYSVLIVLLAVVDFVIILIVLGVSKPMPLWFYPVLFHLQLLPYYTTHFPVTFEEVRPYLVYVASALGLYFPYDFCLYEEASALASYAFRYIPLFLAVVLVPIATVVRKRRSPRNTWHGVWWLILLLYTPAVHTSLTILHCPSFPAQDFNSTQFSTHGRWFVNGNVQCFAGAHTALGLLAIAVLLFAIFILFGLFFVIFAEQKQIKRRPRWTELAHEALRDSFKYWWWGALELFRRFVLVIMTVPFPRNNYPVIFTLSLFAGVTSFIKPYGHIKSHKKSKKGYTWTVNILDIFLASNIIILLLLRNTESVEELFETFPERNQTNVPYDSCSPVGRMTEFAVILTPLYYLPLLASIVAFIVWLGRVIARTVNAHRNSKKATNNTTELEEEQTVPERKQRTETVIDFRSYDPDAPETPKDSLKSPEASITPIKKHYHRFVFKSLSNRLRRPSSANKREQIELPQHHGSKKLKLPYTQDSCPVKVEVQATCHDPDCISYTDI